MCYTADEVLSYERLRGQIYWINIGLFLVARRQPHAVGIINLLAHYRSAQRAKYTMALYWPWEIGGFLDSNIKYLHFTGDILYIILLPPTSCNIGAM